MEKSACPSSCEEWIASTRSFISLVRATIFALYSAVPCLHSHRVILDSAEICCKHKFVENDVKLEAADWRLSTPK